MTAGTAGFVSAYLYCRLLGGESGRWAWNLVLSATVFPAPFLVMFCFLNTVAIIYNSQAALPFGTILVIMLIWNQTRTLTQTRTRTLITLTLTPTLSLTQVIMFIWMLVTLPLTVIGGIVGRNMAKGKDFDAPCRTNKIPREVPPIPWYRQGPCQVLMANPNP